MTLFLDLYASITASGKETFMLVMLTVTLVAHAVPQSSS